MKIVALYSGGDWYDASCEHIILLGNNPFDAPYFYAFSCF